MPTVLLVRHGRTSANASGVLAGWTPGVGLDETGQAQAKTLAERFAPVPLALAVSSPLQRCQETGAAILAVPGPNPKQTRPELLTEERLGECRYGDWTGRPLRELAKEPLWRVVQAHPSAAVFPGEGGEGMLDMQHRAVTAIREYYERVRAEHGDDALWLALSHGDVIKAILADALGMHLDSFQRLVVDPCSVSVIRFTPLRPFVAKMNDPGSDLAALVPPPAPKKRRTRKKPDLSASDAVVGGGAGGPVPAAAVQSAPAPPTGTAGAAASGGAGSSAATVPTT